MYKVKLEGAKRLFFTALSIDIAVTAIVLASDIWAIGIVSDIRAGSTVTEPVSATVDFWATFSKVTILTAIGVGWTLTAWLGACYEYAKLCLKATEFKQAGWVTWGWIVPFMNVFKPYQVLSEIHRAGSTDYLGEDTWRKAPTSGLLMVWWIFWLTAHLILFSLSRYALGASLEENLTLTRILQSVFRLAGAANLAEQRH